MKQSDICKANGIISKIKEIDRTIEYVKKGDFQIENPWGGLLCKRTTVTENRYSLLSELDDSAIDAMVAQLNSMKSKLTADLVDMGVEP